MCKAVMPSSPQRFPTPANRGDNTMLSTRMYRLYSDAERLPTADKEGFAHLQPLLSTDDQTVHATTVNMGWPRLTAQSHST